MTILDKKSSMPANDVIFKRDSYIDFLRSVGLLLLVIAHTSPPAFLKELRSFDVPLMVMISAMCYKPCNYIWRYYIRRFKRIYCPVAFFLTIFFSLSYMFFQTFGKMHFDISQILGSYMLLNEPSIGFVWIFRVFLMIALTLPLISRLINNYNNYIIIVISLATVFIQHIAVQCVDPIKDRFLNCFLTETLLYLIGYSSIVIIGLRIRSFTLKQLATALLVTGILIIVFMFYNYPIFNPNSHKYPPQSLFILYGLFCSMFIWILKPILIRFSRIHIWSYLSKNSLWIYLWHIPTVYGISSILSVEGMWFARYSLVLLLSLLLTFLFNKAVKYLPIKLQSLIL